MKELSIEEKAKAYDITLAKIKMLLGTGSNCSREELEYVFPELKESKDERIRNLIYCLIRDRSDSKKLLEHNGVSVDEALVWLEKQGQNPALSEEDKNMLEWVIGYLENKMLNTPISEERTACKNAIAWLEEKLKGEQKPIEWTMDNIEELTEFENAMMHIGGSFFGEHQGLDPNDTFVVKEQAKILLEMATKQELSEEDARLLENCISLIEDIDCTEDEQNWLKALKYRLQPQPQWSKEDETKIKSIIALLKNPAVCAMDGNKGIIDASIKYLKSLKDRVQPQQKQKWSKEDEAHVDSLLKRLEGMCKPDATFTSTEFAISEDEDWLKDLKDRVQPQPKQEWSEEDENRINRLIAYFEDKESFTAEDDIAYANWLKSLRPKSQWKPSIAQLNALSIVSKGNAPDDIEAIVSLYQDLKKLREE